MSKRLRKNNVGKSNDTIVKSTGKQLMQLKRVQNDFSQQHQSIIKKQDSIINIKITEPVFHYGSRNNSSSISQQEIRSALRSNSPSPPRPRKIITRPPPLKLSHQLLIKGSSNKQVPQQQYQEKPSSSSPNPYNQIDSARNHQSINSPQKTLELRGVRNKALLNGNSPYIDCNEDIRSPPWFDRNGHKLSHIKRGQDSEDDMQISIDREDYSFKVDSNQPKLNDKVGVCQAGRNQHKTEHQKRHMNLQKQSSLQSDDQLHTPNHPIMKNRQGVPISRITELRLNIPPIQLQQEIQDLFQLYQPRAKHESYSGNVLSRKQQVYLKQKQLEKYLVQAEQSLTKKDQIIFKLRLQIRFLAQKFGEIKKFTEKKLKIIPSKMHQFRENQIVKTQNLINQKITEFQFNTRILNQQIIQEEYLKRKDIQLQLDQIKKKLAEKQVQINLKSSEKTHLQKKRRQVNFKQNSPTTEFYKFNSDEKMQLKNQVISLEQKNKSLHWQIQVLSKNMSIRNSKYGQSQDQLHRLNKKLRKQLGQRQQQESVLLSQIQKQNLTQQANLLTFQTQFLQAQHSFTQYKKQTLFKLQQLQQKLQQQKSGKQMLQLRVKQQQLQHYRKVQIYDRTLREVQKDLEMLALKKSIREELRRREGQLLVRESQLDEKDDLLRQQRNQLECAVQLHNYNLVLHQQKQESMAVKHQAAQLQRNTMQTRPQRDHKACTSPVPVNSDAQSTKDKTSLTKLKQNLDRAGRSDRNQRGPFAEHLISSDMKRIAINQRLGEIQTLKSSRRLREQGPCDFRHQFACLYSRPVIHKAKSVETQRQFIISPLREHPQKDCLSSSPKNHLTPLFIARYLPIKPSTTQCNQQYSLVRLKIDQIKSSINNQIATGLK